MNTPNPKTIHFLATETLERNKILYHHQYMLCNCGALFFLPSPNIPKLLKCPGCSKELPVVRRAP
jgi:hypothetical protein